MKRITMLAAFALIGFVAIIVINGATISQLGDGVALPVGWQEPAEQPDMMCTLQARYEQGLPFATSRPAHYCQTAENQLAKVLNLSIGMGLGLITGLLINRILTKK